MRKCVIEGCGQKHSVRGWCRKHYMRWKKHGDPFKVLNNVQQATRTPTTNDLHWAAGFLEGEGSFGWYSGTDKVQAFQVQKEPLDKLMEIFGGSLCVRKSPYPGIWSDAWVWTINGARARGVMMTLYALMSPKRQQQIETPLQPKQRSENGEPIRAAEV